MSELGDKLRKVRIAKGLSQQDTAAITGIKYKTINDYENGKSRPDVEKLALLCEAYNTSADYFINVNIFSNTSQNTLNDLELEHIKKYRTLDEYGKDVVETILEKELYRTKEQKKNMFVKEKQASYLCSPAERTYPEGIYQIDDFKNEEENRISMPVYDIGVSAGTGVFLDTPCYEVISVPEDLGIPKSQFCIMGYR